MPTFLQLVGLLFIIWGAMAAVFVAGAWFGGWGDDDQESVELTANDAADPKVVDLVARLREARRPRALEAAAGPLRDIHDLTGDQFSHRGDKK